MKNVTAAASGPVADVSTEVLYGKIELQSRWSLGSLVAGVLSQSAVPLCLFLTTAAQGALRLRAIPSPAPSAALPGATAGLKIVRAAGTGKSRPVSIIKPDAVVVTGGQVEIGADPAVESSDLTTLPGLIRSLTVAEIPSFSLLGILNKLESYLDSLPPGWVLVIDQDTESILFYGADNGADTRLEQLETDFGTDPLYDFTLEADQASDVVPGYGWE